jgi:hypothetical protein
MAFHHIGIPPDRAKRAQARHELLDHHSIPRKSGIANVFGMARMRTPLAPVGAVSTSAASASESGGSCRQPTSAGRRDPVDRGGGRKGAATGAGDSRLDFSNMVR